MFKKFIAIILMVSCVLTTMCIPASATDEAVEIPREAALLEKLGIIYPKAQAEYAKEISRADFAVYIARLLGVDDTLRDDNVRYYADVAAGDYATYSINELVKKGLLSVGEDKLFRPQDAITYTEAVKVAVCAAGYGELAKEYGGYPMGYLRVANELELSYGGSFKNEVFTLSDAIRLIYDTAIAPMYVITSVIHKEDGTGIIYDKSNVFTLLFENFGYKHTDGILTGFDGIDVDFGNPSAEGRAVIDNVSYRVKEDLDLTAFVGRRVGAIYKDEDVIEFVYPGRISEDCIEIDIADYMDFDGDNIIYKKNDNDTQKVNIRGAAYLYNTDAPKNSISEYLNNLESGTISIINSDGKAGWDSVIICDYHSFVVKSVDTLNDIIYSLNGQTAIKLEDYEKVEIVDAIGNEVLIDKLVKEDVLNVLAAPDKSRLKIVLSQKKAVGTVNQIKVGTPNKVTLDDAEYTINRKYVYTSDLQLGHGATLLLNMFGEVVYATDAEISTMTKGYLEAMTTNGVFSSNLMLRIFTKNDGLKVYETASRFYIDGAPFTDGDTAKDYISNVDGDNTFKSQIILFTTNDEGKVTEIDTHKLGVEQTEETSLKRVIERPAEDGSDAPHKYYDKITKVVKDAQGKTNYERFHMISNDTDFFCVPKTPTNNPDDYFVLKRGSFNTIRYDFECYKSNGDDEYLDSVIYRYDVDDNKTITNWERGSGWYNSYIFVVSSITGAIDEKGKEYKKLEGYRQANLTELNVYDENIITRYNHAVTVDDLDEGDMIRWREDEKGRVVEIQKLYDAEDGTLIDWNSQTDGSTLVFFDTTTNHTTYGNNMFELSVGYVNKRGENVVTFGKTSGANRDDAFDLTSSDIVVYDPNRLAGQRVYVGSISSIDDYETVGDDCDFIIVNLNKMSLRATTVYKKKITQ